MKLKHCALAALLFVVPAACGPETRVTSEEFQAGDRPLTVDGGSLRCERRGSVVLPVFRPDGRDAEFSFRMHSQDYPDLFAPTSPLWAWDTEQRDAAGEPIGRISYLPFAEWAEAICGPRLQ